MTSGKQLALRILVQPLMKRTSVLALIGEELGDLVADLAIGELDIILGGAVVGHEGKEPIVSDIELHSVVRKCLVEVAGAHSRAGIPGGGRWGHPCCAWRGRAPPASCR